MIQNSLFILSVLVTIYCRSTLGIDWAVGDWLWIFYNRYTDGLQIAVSGMVFRDVPTIILPLTAIFQIARRIAERRKG